MKMEQPPRWHLLSIETTIKQLRSDPANGLTAQQVADLQAHVGPNELAERAERSSWRLLWEQFTATMVLILIAAGMISLFLQKWQEAVAIFAIVVLFGLLGFVQEYRAERAMAALKKLAAPMVRVRREGQVKTISARELVPGDIVLLEAGNLVPADMRLLETVNLRIQEATLTGESEVVEKDANPVFTADAPLGDRRNMAYMGTVVTYGRGVGIVVETGARTELGKIATLLQTVEREATPLQRRLDRLGKGLALMGVMIAAIVAVFGLLRGGTLGEMFLVAVSVAVAIVPEGLPAVVTITLALGARRMLARNALIRKLPAVETLGSVTVICTDKTGTLTQNRMTVTVLDLIDHSVQLSEQVSCKSTGPDSAEQPDAAKHLQADALSLLLSAGALANDAQLIVDDQGKWRAVGDPTEGALVLAAAQLGLPKDDLERWLPRVLELPFDSERKRMTTVHELNIENAALAMNSVFARLPLPQSRFVAFTKGSVDGLLEIAAQVWVNGSAQPITPEWRQHIEASNTRLAQEGLRVLAVAFRWLDRRPLQADESLERDLTLIGLFGMIDPPRPEAQEAVAKCKMAGIRPLMITGDHPLTALAIAKKVGIADDGDHVITGLQLSQLSDEQMSAELAHVSVFARVSPEHKLRIVTALQRQGHVVAMTGDGVNDAPALKKADIGVAMGVAGTDVSREAAEIVLLDDNFATIVRAVEEGRTIYDNIKKFVKFSVGGNLGKVMVMLLAPMLAPLLPASSLPPLLIPLMPLQLLWLNLLTDGLLGIGLGVEPAEKNVMRRPPTSPQANIFSGGGLGQVIRMGVLIGAIALGVGLHRWSAGYEDWQTMMFTTLAFLQVWQALSIRTGSDSIVQAGLFSNQLLALLAAGVVGLQLATIYAPVLQPFLNTTPLAAQNLLTCIALSSVVFVYGEIEKALARRAGHLPVRRVGLESPPLKDGSKGSVKL